MGEEHVVLSGIVLVHLPLVGKSKNAEHFSGGENPSARAGPPPAISSLRSEISTYPRGGGVFAPRRELDLVHAQHRVDQHARRAHVAALVRVLLVERQRRARVEPVLFVILSFPFF
jgi:hypothetical protein